MGLTSALSLSSTVMHSRIDCRPVCRRNFGGRQRRRLETLFAREVRCFQRNPLVHFKRRQPAQDFVNTRVINWRIEPHEFFQIIGMIGLLDQGGRIPSVNIGKLYARVIHIGSVRPFLIHLVERLLVDRAIVFEEQLADRFDTFVSFKGVGFSTSINFRAFCVASLSSFTVSFTSVIKPSSAAAFWSIKFEMSAQVLAPAFWSSARNGSLRKAIWVERINRCLSRLNRARDTSVSYSWRP